MVHAIRAAGRNFRDMPLDSQMMHELPRKYTKGSTFPGAPMHPHRGFCELPYAKEISGGNSDQYGHMVAKDHTGETCHVRRIALAA